MAHSMYYFLLLDQIKKKKVCENALSVALDDL